MIDRDADVSSTIRLPEVYRALLVWCRRRRLPAPSKEHNATLTIIKMGVTAARPSGSILSIFDNLFMNSDMEMLKVIPAIGQFKNCLYLCSVVWMEMATSMTP